MADLIGAIQNLIVSPPGQILAAGILGGVVTKSFEKADGILTDQTKFEIAVWLVGIHTKAKAELWFDACAVLFDRVFGARHLSFRCFVRSLLFSLASLVLTSLICLFFDPRSALVAFNIVRGGILSFCFAFFCVNGLLDYISLLKTRYILRLIADRSALALLGCLALDGLVTLYIALICFDLGLATEIASPRGVMPLGFLNPAAVRMTHSITSLRFFLRMAIHPSTMPGASTLWFFPPFFPSLWLWLYAVSGFVLKAARHFDIGFQFNHKFDIEKKPLSSIGLVAGALVALSYLGMVGGAWAWLHWGH